MQPNPYYPYRRSQPVQGGKGSWNPETPAAYPPGVNLPTDIIPPGTVPTGTNVVPPGVSFEQGPPSGRDIGYIQEYLARNIGRYAKMDFLIGTNMIVDREGVIKEVGTNYVVIQEPQTDDLVMCDLFSLKFVKTFY